MEVIKELNVPADFFYNKMIDSALFDVRKQTGKKLTRKQLGNFEYIKEFSKNSRAKIKVEKLTENQSYHFRTSTTKNDYFVQYEIKSKNDNSCIVHYTETMKSFGFLQQLNDAIFALVLGFFKKKQFVKMLKMIEESY